MGRMPAVAALVLRADIVDARRRLVELDLEGGDERVLGLDVDVVRLAVEGHADRVLLLHRAHLSLFWPPQASRCRDDSTARRGRLDGSRPRASRCAGPPCRARAGGSSSPYRRRT